MTTMRMTTVMTKRMTMTLTIAAMTIKVRMKMTRGVTMLKFGKVVHN